jgi:hypothetical protein
MYKFFAGIEGYMAEKGLTKAPNLQKLGVKEVHIEDILTETLFRIVEGGMRDGYEHMFEAFGLEKGYEDLKPKDFIRFLDEAAHDLAFEALTTGGEYVVVGGQKKMEVGEDEEFAREFYKAKDRYSVVDIVSDARLVAEALQILLTRLVNGFLYGVNRAENKVAAFQDLNVCEDVLWYIAEHAGLLKK